MIEMFYRSCQLSKSLIINPQTHVIFPHYVVSNDPEYVRSPELFLPERWLKAADRTSETPSGGCPHLAQAEHQKIHPFVSLPFGYGRRTCLGRRFAEAELQIMLSKVTTSIFIFQSIRFVWL